MQNKMSTLSNKENKSFDLKLLKIVTLNFKSLMQQITSFALDMNPPDQICYRHNLLVHVMCANQSKRSGQHGSAVAANSCSQTSICHFL